jgi:hypothetical protein
LQILSEETGDWCMVEIPIRENTHTVNANRSY